MLLRSSRFLLRHAVASVWRRPLATQRMLSYTAVNAENKDPLSGRFVRTDADITVEHPEPHDLPSSKVVQRYKRTLSSFSLERKTAVITGGARGLGYVMTQALVESGANVAIVDIDGDEAANAAARLLDHFRISNPDADAMPTITSHCADVASAHSVDTAFADILAAHNTITTLITSAGICENHRAEDYPPDRLQHLLNINITGTYLFSAAAARHFIAQKTPGASIIMIGSMSGTIVNIPQPQAPYNASKAAVRHLASSFAVEWAGHGIRVNCISPGYMMTALTEKILGERPELGREWVGRVPMGRMGKPEDLMGAVVFLASDAAAYVTGAELVVDGGYTVV